MDNNSEELRITIASIILATGLAVLAFTDFESFYKIFFGAPAFMAFLYILAVANSLRFYDNDNDHIFPTPIFLFSARTKRGLYNLTIDFYIISLISMFIWYFLSKIPFFEDGIIGYIIFILFFNTNIAIPFYRKRLRKIAAENKTAERLD